MRKEIIKKIEIPEDIKIEIDGKKLIIEGKMGKLEREFRGKFFIEKKGNLIEIGNKKATKNEKKLINSTTAHVRNMMHGAKEGYEYKLKAVSAHFPMTLSVEGKYLVIKNFLGEVKPRKAKILPGVEIKIDKDNIITLSSADKEKTGQTSANIESATRIMYRDRRVFQDGIFIIEKPRREK